MREHTAAKEDFPVVGVDPADLAQYFLYRSSQDGDLITPLKMQKMVYLAYGVHLAKKRKKLFSEAIEAWPNGPVVPSLYRALQDYGSFPIPDQFIDVATPEELIDRFPPDVKVTLDSVYENYIGRSAFDLVSLTHSQKAWLVAREGLSDTQPSNNPLSDTLIFEAFSNDEESK